MTTIVLPPEAIKEKFGDLNEDTVTPPSTTTKRRQRMSAMVDTVASVYHTGSRKVKRTMSRVNWKKAAYSVASFAFFIVSFLVGFYVTYFVALWLYSMSPWLYAAFSVAVLIGCFKLFSLGL